MGTHTDQGRNRRKATFFKMLPTIFIPLIFLICGGGMPLRAQSSGGQAPTAQPAPIQPGAEQSSASDWEVAAGGKMAFEAASVKQNKSGLPPSGNTPKANFPLGPGDLYYPNGGLFSGTNLPASTYIMFAYKMSQNQLKVLLDELPKWATTERFDIQARANGNPTKDQMRLMMQSLLADRFKVLVHTEVRQLPVFALALVKTGKTGPLVMEGRDPSETVAATRMRTGTDVDYGALTSVLLDSLRAVEGFSIKFLHRVQDLKRPAGRTGGRWTVTVRDELTGETTDIETKFVFIGAGGGSLPLLQKSGIPEGHGYAGFPVSGIWLRCDDAKVASRHHAKVYGKASVGSPPMSVPHSDTRHVNGKVSILFGPYAGFSTKFLKHGS